MNDQANYPARGQMSEDGVFFTDNKGVVYARREIGHYSCSGCDIDKSEFNQVACSLCGNDIWRLYKDTPIVPSSEEVDACEMARAMIEYCEDFRSLWECGENHSPTIGRPSGCVCCPKCANKSCPARVYLAAHGDARAWEVK